MYKGIIHALGKRLDDQEGGICSKCSLKGVCIENQFTNIQHHFLGICGMGNKYYFIKLKYVPFNYIKGIMKNVLEKQNSYGDVYYKIIDVKKQKE